MNFIKSILVLILLSPLFLFAQGEGQNWYFGYNAGLDFTGGSPVAMTNGSVNQWEGVASISDAAGNLLFYTNGQNIWDATHGVMQNGSGLMGHNSASQSAVIVPKPYAPGIYYVFTVDKTADGNGVRYSIVDMNLNGSLGAVTGVKNILLMSNTTEKITAVRHANNSDIWVICHKWGSNQFQSFLINGCSGLQTTPVISNVGSSHTHVAYSANTGAIGYMKASPQGNKLGLAFFTQPSSSSPHFELFDFNNNTGGVSNSITLPSPSSTPKPPGITYYAAYGVEFSPDGTFFYGGLNATGEIYQYDLSAGGATAIRNSATLVGTGTGLASNSNKIGALQLATDGKIYVARDGMSSLGAITNPNSYGAFYTDNAVGLGGSTSGLGLPTFIQSFFISALDLSVNYSGNKCVGNSIAFNLQGVDVSNVDHVDWDFGDGTTLTNQNSSGTVNHTYSSSGTYYVEIKYYFVTAGCIYYGTIGRNINIAASPTATAVTSGSYCTSGSAVSLNGTTSGGTWSGTGVSGSSFYPSLAGVGTHTLTYSLVNGAGCTDSDNTTVTVNQTLDATITTSTTSMCLAEPAITLTAASNGGTWTGAGVVNGQFDPSIAGIGSHTITYSTSNNGCTDSDTHTINVTNTADATITAVGTVCSNDSPISLSAVTSGGTWSGTGVSSNQFDPSSAGVGTHTLTYTITGVCGDVDTETITVTQAPDASFTGGGPYCSEDNAVTLTSTTAGGTFSGTGISTNSFDPSAAGVGSFPIQYSVTANGCTASTTETLVVNQTPDATITSITSLCTSDASITLTSNTPGGTWTGTAVNVNTFDPSVSGGGSFAITYNVTTGSCSNSESVTINVIDNPDPTINLSGPFCPTDGAVTLTAASPGGTWTGTGITDANLGTFDPSLITGNSVITYTIGGSCGGVDTETFISDLGYCDHDNDGVNDNEDPDDDNDGVLDVDEDINGDGDFMNDDTDGDGIPNVFDLDSDNDGIVDVIEGGGQDPDGDGIIGTGPITDADNDGLDDSVDNYNSGAPVGEVTNGTPLPLPNTDNDGNGLYNVIDIDSDNDGIVDNIEGQASNGFTPPTGNDQDQDGIDDAYDLDNQGTPIVPENTDGDSEDDYMDLDSDNDSDNDILEGWDMNNDGVADITPSGNDSDNDGLDDAFDLDGTSSINNGEANNGVTVLSSVIIPNMDDPNTPEYDWREALDHDHDGVTDSEDPDDDNDGILDVDEDTNGDGDFSNDDADGDGIPNNFDLDSDNDGIVDVIEAGGEDPDGDGIIGTGPITDADHDGLADSVDDYNGGAPVGEITNGTPLSNPDTDNDGMVDVIDLDADNDGIVDNIEAQTSDDYIPPVGNDTDQDGIDDAYDLDNGGTPLVPVNTDEAEDNPDYTDLNSDNDNDDDILEGWDEDNDGYADTTPSGNDSDADGIDDAFDVDGTSTVNNGGPTNGGSLATDFPNNDDVDSDELDWREVETYVIIPNIFTPNGDGINDEFVLNTSNMESLSTTIFNRWGQTIYEWKGVNGSWDGYTKASQEATEGTYFYLIIGVDNLGEKFEYKGSVVLDR